MIEQRKNTQAGGLIDGDGRCIRVVVPTGETILRRRQNSKTQIVAWLGSNHGACSRKAIPSANPIMPRLRQRPMVRTIPQPGNRIHGSLNAHSNVTPVYSSILNLGNQFSIPVVIAPMVEGVAMAWCASIGSQQSRLSSFSPHATASTW